MSEAIVSDTARYFVILAALRTGSNLLQTQLQQYPDIECYGELFNAGFIGEKGIDSLLGYDTAKRNASPRAFLDKLIASNQSRIVGFRLFEDHNPIIEQHVIADPNCRKIILRRNAVDSFLSLRLAQETGQWISRRPTSGSPRKVRFDPPMFLDYCARMDTFYSRIHDGLRVSGQSAFFVDYEELKRIEILNGLAAYLGSAHALEAVREWIYRQNPGTHRERIVNFEEVCSSVELAATRFPNLIIRLDANHASTPVLPGQAWLRRLLGW